MEAFVEVVLEGITLPNELLFLCFTPINLLLFINKFLMVDHLNQCLLALLPAFMDCLQFFVKLLNTFANVGLVALKVVRLFIGLNLVDTWHHIDSIRLSIIV